MTENAAPATKTAIIDNRRGQSALRRFYVRNGRAVNSFATFVAVWLFFASQNWMLFLDPGFSGS